MLRRWIPTAATTGLRPFQSFFPDMLWRVDTDRREVYLTFDDGPTTALTDDLLDLLAAYDARATCFLIGHHVEEHPDLARAIHRAGHTIGNHTYTHLDAWTSPQDAVRTQLSRTTMELEDLLGTQVRFMRPPYGHPTGAMRTWCAERQQRMVMWDVMPGDFLKTATAEQVASFVLDKVRPGSVVVLHDNPICEGVTLPALETILSTLDRDGWTFNAL
mgnify:FL=1